MATHQGIYVSPMEIRPNSATVSKKDLKDLSDKKLWVINYEIKNYSKGIAIIKARDIVEAETLLKYQGAFNGWDYSITRVIEVPQSFSSKLLCEQAIRYSELN